MEKLIFFTIIVWSLYFLVDYLLCPNKKNLKDQYIKALQNNDRKNALVLGRKYYSSVSPFGYMRPVDEMSLMNDINNFCK
jgi:hypothetical protein